MEAGVPRKRKSSHAALSKKDGFTLLQVVVVLAVGLIISAAAVISIRAGRPGLQLANSAHQFAGYMERARADSVRRRAAVGAESGIQILNNRTYRVTMGFGGSDTLTSRDFPLEGDVVFTTDPTTVNFDWRGRPTIGTETTFALQNSSGTTQVDVTGSGDVTVGSEIFQDAAVPNVNLNANVSGDVAPDPTNPNSTPTPEPTSTPPPTAQDPTPTPTPGTDASPTPTPDPSAEPLPTPRPTATPSVTPTPTPTPSPSQTPGATPSPSPTPTPCVPSVSPGSISVHRNGGSGTVTVTLGGSGGAVSGGGPSNLTISPGAANIAIGGSTAFTITSNSNTRGNFTVTFTTPCGQTSVSVSVTN